MRHIELASFALATLIGCGGSTGASEPPATAGAPEGAAPPPPAGAPAEEPLVGPPDVQWKDMTDEQRASYMKAVVLPTMKAKFQAFDSKHFADFTCKTCHGAGMDDKSFDMPNPKLPKLPGTPEGFQALMKEEPQWVRFMGEQVKPEMAKLLGLPEFDPQHPAPDAFGCGNCHSTEGQ